MERLLLGCLFPHDSQALQRQKSGIPMRQAWDNLFLDWHLTPYELLLAFNWVACQDEQLPSASCIVEELALLGGETYWVAWNKRENLKQKKQLAFEWWHIYSPSGSHCMRSLAERLVLTEHGLCWLVRLFQRNSEVGLSLLAIGILP